MAWASLLPSPAAGGGRRWRNERGVDEGGGECTEDLDGLWDMLSVKHVISNSHVPRVDTAHVCAACLITMQHRARRDHISPDDSLFHSCIALRCP